MTKVTAVKSNRLPFRPVGNMALIEVEREYKEIVRNDADEQTKKGILRDVSISPIHLTESGGLVLSNELFNELFKELKKLIGETVSYQEYADSGRKVEVDGREFVTVPWYRIIGVWNTNLEAELING